VDAVLVVDDGSTDDTKEVSHETNNGKGHAVRTALGYAVDNQFDALVLLDGDGQHNPNAIPLMFEPLRNDSADFVIGFRQLKQMPVYRRIGRSLLDHTTDLGNSVTDSQSGFRALNRKTIDVFQRTLAKDDFAIESEMLRRVHDEHLRLVEVKINTKYGNFDISTWI
jgi:glycosyltransferase involved in cell wall biosynthesis